MILLVAEYLYVLPESDLPIRFGPLLGQLVAVRTFASQTSSSG